MPQPLMSVGSMPAVVTADVPNVVADDAWQAPFAALFVKSQLGILSTPTGTVMIFPTVAPPAGTTKLRVAVVAIRAIGLLIE